MPGLWPVVRQFVAGDWLREAEEMAALKADRDRGPAASGFALRGVISAPPKVRAYAELLS
jgi:hypothetical protein